MDKKYWTDHQIIEAIRNGGQKRNLAWEYIYKAWRPYYVSAINTLGGNEDQINEIISNVIISVELQILKPDFFLHSTTLIKYFTICLKNAWFKYMQKPDSPSLSDEDILLHIGQPPEVFKMELRNHLDYMLTLLGDSCKKILTLWAERYSMVEIAVEMKLASEQSAKNAKSDCFKKLVQIAPYYGK